MEFPGRFGCILADPPWSYQNMSSKAHGAAVSAFDCMTDIDIGNVPVSQWCLDDSWLALWATFPKLPEAMNVMDLWGFTYVTAVPWVKTIPSTGCIARGVGFHTMGAAELLLLGRHGQAKLKTRDGTPIGLLEGQQKTFYSPRGRHSEKPECVQDWLGRRYDGPYLELFARRFRLGWVCLGHELGHHLGPSGVSSWAEVKV